MKTILFFLLYLILVCIVLSTAQAQCNLTDAELKARGMYRDTTAYTWIVNDQATCISVAFGRKRDGEIVIRDLNRTLQLLQGHQDSLFNKILLDRLLQRQATKHVDFTITSGTVRTMSYSGQFTYVNYDGCVNIFHHMNNQTGEIIEWKVPCKNKLP